MGQHMLIKVNSTIKIFSLKLIKSTATVNYSSSVIEIMKYKTVHDLYLYIVFVTGISTVKAIKLFVLCRKSKRAVFLHFNSIRPLLESIDM